MCKYNKDLTVICDSKHLKKYLPVNEMIDIIFIGDNPRKEWEELIENTKKEYDFDINSLVYIVKDDKKYDKETEIIEIEDWLKVMNYLSKFGMNREFFYVLNDIRKEDPNDFGKEQ